MNRQVPRYLVFVFFVSVQLKENYGRVGYRRSSRQGLLPWGAPGRCVMITMSEPCRYQLGRAFILSVMNLAFESRADHAPQRIEPKPSSPEKKVG